MECRRENLPVEHLDLYSKVRLLSSYILMTSALPFQSMFYSFIASDGFLLSFRYLQKFSDLKADLSRTERHILKEMGFVCHVEHPHKFISNYLATLETPPELRQEAWNLANDRYFCDTTTIFFTIFLFVMHVLFIDAVCT